MVRIPLPLGLTQVETEGSQSVLETSGEEVLLEFLTLALLRELTSTFTTA